MIDIGGFRCTNHLPDRRTLAAGRFDVDNPCSWCSNRKHQGAAGPAFYYVTYGRWEFPFIAEANCENYSLIVKPSAAKSDKAAWAAASTIHRHRNRVSEIGRQFETQWHAFATGEAPMVGGRIPKVGEILYPSGKNAVQFYTEINSLRSDLFGLRHDLHAVAREFNAAWGIRDSQLDFWLEQQTKLLAHLARQTEELDARKKPSALSVVANVAFENILGNATWEGFKYLANLVREMLRL